MTQTIYKRCKRCGELKPRSKSLYCRVCIWLVNKEK